jgi:hypothetical protein
LIRDKEYDFGVDPLQLPELKWKFVVGRADLTINPETYVHLLNISDIFNRPTVRMGDLEKLQQNERKNIFQNASRIDFVRKKGNTLKYWYEYIAVFSGSYIYFYPADQLKTIEKISKYYKKTLMIAPEDSSKVEEHTKMNKKEKAFKNIIYEGSFLVKGCTSTQNYSSYL